MSVKATMRELLEVDIDGLGALKGLPAKPAYTVAKLIRRVRTEVELFNEARNKVIKEHGLQDPAKPGVYTVPKEKMTEVEELVKPLLDAEIQIDVNPLSLSECPALTGDNLPGTLSTVTWFIQE